MRRSEAPTLRATPGAAAGALLRASPGSLLGEVRETPSGTRRRHPLAQERAVV